MENNYLPLNLVATQMTETESHQQCLAFRYAFIINMKTLSEIKEQENSTGFSKYFKDTYFDALYFYVLKVLTN